MTPHPVNPDWSFSATRIEITWQSVRFCRECGTELKTEAFVGRVFDGREWIMYKAANFCGKPCVEEWARALGAVVDHAPMPA